MKRNIALFVVLGGLMHTFAGYAHAQGGSISVYPPIIEVQTTPPSSPVTPITIQNNNDQDITLKIELIPFRTNNVTGQTVLIPEEGNKGFYPYYADRIQFLVDNKKTDSITLAPLESKRVDLNIHLIEGDPPGDYYYSIVFLSDSVALQDTSEAHIPLGIASNLLLSIGPKDESAGGISQFSTSSFKTAGPVEFMLKLHNASKHVINPTGNIEITNLFGQKVGSVNILPQYVLAGADRFLLDSLQSSPSAVLSYQELRSIPKIIWPEKFLFGWYHATARIQLEENGKAITASTYFFAFPLYLFFPLVMVIFIIISIYLKVKRII
jgi:hypothetical protein